MKTKTFPLLVALTAPVCVHAADPTLSFPPTRIELPPLSALEAAHASRGSQKILNQSGQLLPPVPTFLEAKQRSVSKMPILIPQSGIDPKMLVSPIPGIDYKLRVVDPRVESVASK